MEFVNSPVGKLYIVGDHQSLYAITWSKTEAEGYKAFDVPGAEPVARAKAQLAEYFSGQRKLFALPLAPEGTKFQQRVWKMLSTIPFGETRSYKDIAVKIKNTGAVRAVGNANGKNPFAVVVPCHRVLAHDGTLGGYTGGLKKKEFLLQLESKQV